jgi:hypothetical protein
MRGPCRKDRDPVENQVERALWHWRFAGWVNCGGSGRLKPPEAGEVRQAWLDVGAPVRSPAKAHLATLERVACAPQTPKGRKGSRERNRRLRSLGSRSASDQADQSIKPPPSAARGQPWTSATKRMRERKDVQEVVAGRGGADWPLMKNG